MIAGALYLLLLASISTVLLGVGCFLYVSQAWSGPQASLRIRIIGTALVIAGLLGDAFAVLSLLKITWKALQ